MKSLFGNTPKIKSLVEVVKKINRLFVENTQRLLITAGKKGILLKLTSPIQIKWMLPCL